jgi:lysophospholipase L1-like esterase
VQFHPNDVVLFQGDSITDKGRSRTQTGPNTPESLGSGYVFLCASDLLARFPSHNLKVLSRGISGDKIPTLLARWQTDALDLKPHVLSLMVGVNDTGHRFVPGMHGVPVPDYEKGYRKLLDWTKATLPAVRLVLCEPFTLPCGSVNDQWEPEMTQRRAIVKQLAKDYAAVFVPFQSAFDAASRATGPRHWCDDGIHPTMAGHGLMARTWLQAVLRD